MLKLQVGKVSVPRMSPAVVGRGERKEIVKQYCAIMSPQSQMSANALLQQIPTSGAWRRSMEQSRLRLGSSPVGVS